MSLEHMVRDEQESWRLLLEEAEREGEFGMNNDQLVKIANHLQGQIDLLDKQSAMGYDHSFDDYKAVYDTLIALRQAQALAGINEKLESINANLEKVYIIADENADLQDIARQLGSITSVLRDK